MKAPNNLSFIKYLIILFHILGNNLHTENFLLPFAFFQFLFDFHYISFYKLDKIPFPNPNIDILNYFINKSFFGRFSINEIR